MKVRSVLLVMGLAAVAGAIATGFPKRIGASRLEAALMLPGDDVLPEAAVVVDRAISIDATPEKVWTVLNDLVEEDEEMMVHSRIDNQALVLASTDVEDEYLGTMNDVDATWAFVVTARADGTTRLHLRERQQPHAPSATVASWADVTVNSVTTMMILRNVKLLSESTD